MNTKNSRKQEAVKARAAAHAALDTYISAFAASFDSYEGRLTTAAHDAKVALAEAVRVAAVAESEVIS